MKKHNTKWTSRSIFGPLAVTTVVTLYLSSKTGIIATGEKGLTVIGVHSPEFDDERQVENLRREVVSLGINYPVVTDNDYQRWNAYHVEAWPTIALLDKRGRIRWMHVGEGDYDRAEQLIQKLLGESDTYAS